MPGEDQPKLPSELLQAAAGATTLLTVLGGLAVTGALERLQRNDPNVMTMALTCVIVAGTLWVFASIARSGSPHEKTFKVVGAGFLAAGLVVGAIGVVHTHSTSERPSIGVSLKEGMRIDGTIKVAGLTSDERLRVIVDGLVGADHDDDGAPRAWKPYRIYNITVGPDADGVARLPLNVPVAPGTYDAAAVRAWTGDEFTACEYDENLGASATGRRKLETGCLLFVLPRRAPTPQIGAVWELTKRRPVLAVRVSSENAPHRASLYVLAISGNRRLVLGQSLLMPDASGRIDAVVRASVPPGVRRVCAVARWFAPTRRLVPGCPPTHRRRTAVVSLRVPQADRA